MAHQRDHAALTELLGDLADALTATGRTDPAVPVAPIVIDAHGDLEVFATVQSACLSMEAVDVRSGEYEAFDSRGVRLELLADDETVSLRADRRPATDADEVIGRLREYVIRVGTDRVDLSDPADAALDELLWRVLRWQRTR
jgi:hypothetical protein